MAQPDRLTVSYQVLSNYELLEHILSHLDLLDLMQTRQVCHQWQNLTTRSKLLQQNLFLHPPSKQQPSPSHGLQPDSTRISRTQSESSHGGITYTPHPLFSKIFTPQPLHSWTFGFLPSDLARLLSLKGMRWRDMFITQPPVRKLFVRVHLNTWAAVDSTSVSNANGVRLGGLVRGINEVLYRNGVFEGSEKWLRERSGRDRAGRVVLVYWNWLNCEALI